MLKLKLSKLKQICSSVMLPKLLLKNFKYPNEFSLNRCRTLDQLSKARKSTNSHEKNDGNEKQTQCVDKCVTENITEASAKDLKYNEDVVTPECYKITQCEKCNFILSKIFNDEITNKKDPSVIESKLQATTSRMEEEKLAQKVEVVDETPHVEAHPPKIDGFNVTPKVLGQESCTFEMSKQNYGKAGDSDQQTSLDELAKRCMGSPVSEIDKVISQELKNISQSNSHPNLDMDLLRNQCKENDDQIANTPLGPLYGTNTSSRFDKILPLHLDSTPLLTLDSSSIVTNDYKNLSHIREYPTIVLTADDTETSDKPAKLSPYEKPAMPFYEYLNKENIKPDDSSKMEAADISETADDTEIVINEETLQKDVIPPQSSTEGEALHPKPNINQFTETTQPETFINDRVLRIFNTQRVFSSKPDQPIDWQMTGQQYQAPQKQNEIQMPSSSISSAYLPGGSSRSIDLPVNTAISANQSPDEYYNMSLPYEFIPENQTTPVQQIFAECPVTQNIFYTALPRVELEETPNRTEANLDNVLSQKDPLSHMMQQSEVKPEAYSNEVVNDATLTEPATKEDSIPCSESIPLSLLLKRIREKNRLEYCRNLIAKAQIEIEGTKKFSCPPPMDKNKPKSSVKPCQPEPKPKCKPCPAPCPAECPTKKDPCAKFLPIFLSTMYRCGNSYQDTLAKELLNHNKATIKLNPVNIITKDIVNRIKEMGEKFKLINAKNNTSFNNVEMYARDFEPWIPIPSWPIPKKEEAKPFACPKEGCKLPARSNKPCKQQQCDGMAKKSFASVLFLSPITNNVYNE